MYFGKRCVGALHSKTKTMANILSIQSSIKGEQSVSKRLSKEIINHLLETYAGSIVTERDLSTAPVPHFEALHMQALYTPQSERSATQLEAASHSDGLIEEVLDADIIVIGVPFYNFNIPSTLKSWLDHITVAGKTFKYTDGKPQGLIHDKKVFLAIAVGGVYDHEPLLNVDNTEPFMRWYLGFLGMTDVTVFKADGQNMPDIRELHLQEALQAIDEFAY